MDSNFQVDLSGVVDLLSRHLYSSPRVYLRELVQNAVDAITARRLRDPNWRGHVVVIPADQSDDGCLHVSDTGTGLSRTDIDEVLATIGRSSKRDELGFARDDFLGQFGIGLLSCFMVTDLITMTTRAESGTETLQWRGSSAGTYEVTVADTPLAEPGTDVGIRPNRGSEHLVSTAQVRELLTAFAGYLPIPVTLRTREGDLVINKTPLPWEDPNLSGIARRRASIQLCQHLLGFTPLDVIELSDPESGTRGCAFVLPTAAHRPTHRVYAKHMLLSESIDGVVPDWAFFVRAVINTDHLRPTASREALYDDEHLAKTRERFGDQLKRWIDRTALNDPTTMTTFLRAHHVSVKAMALHDDGLLATVCDLLPMETSLGELTISQFTESQSLLRYCATVEDFRQVRPFAREYDLPVINAGFTYDVDLLNRLAEVRTDLKVDQLSPSSLVEQFRPLPAAEQRRFARFLELASTVLVRSGCLVRIQSFAPDELPAVLLSDADGRREATRIEVMEAADDTWSALLGNLAQPDSGPRFVLNAANPIIDRLAGLSDERLQTLGIEALYAQALVNGQHRMRPFDTALVARALPALIDAALNRGS